ncbi:type IV secretion protein Rhs, partial [Pseudomonas sp. SMN5]
FAYDGFGRLQALVNENGESYRFAWDAGDRLVEQQDLDGSAKRYSYDMLDNVSAVTALPAPYGNGLAVVPEQPPAPIVHRLERDAAGRLIAKITDDGRTDYTYDPLDQLTAVTFTDLQGNVQSLSFAYDATGQLLEEHSAAGRLQHHYDE